MPKTWTVPPTQSRSRDSMQRLLRAAEELLETRHWDSISVAEIVRHARSSVGSFYARFHDKDAMLHCLDEENLADMEAAIAGNLQPGRWRGASLGVRVEALVSFLISYHRQRRGLLRALMLVARLRPNREFQEVGDKAIPRIDDVLAFLLERREEISHPDPEHAVRFSFTIALNGVREAVLFPESPSGAIHQTDNRLGQELTRAICAYLGLDMRGNYGR